MGLLSGLGAATADALYGCVAAFGLTVGSDVLIGHGAWLWLIGGAVLCHLGLRPCLTAPAREAAPLQVNSLFGAYA